MSRDASLETTATAVRRKCCRHCLYGKQPLGTPETQADAKMRVPASPHHFTCHEHTVPVVCAGYFARFSERLTGPVRKVQEDGDLKRHYSHLTREQMDACRYRTSAPIDVTTALPMRPTGLHP